MDDGRPQEGGAPRPGEAQGKARPPQRGPLASTGGGRRGGLLRAWREPALPRAAAGLWPPDCRRACVTAGHFPVWPLVGTAGPHAEGRSSTHDTSPALSPALTTRLDPRPTLQRGPRSLTWAGSSPGTAPPDPGMTSLGLRLRICKSGPGQAVVGWPSVTLHVIVTALPSSEGVLMKPSTCPWLRGTTSQGHCHCHDWLLSPEL